MNASTCICRNKEAFPLNKQCQIGEVAYKGTFSSKNPNYKEKKYSGMELRNNLSKDAYTTTSLSFRHEFYKSDTELIKELWQIKMKNYTPEITSRIIRKHLI